MGKITPVMKAIGVSAFLIIFIGFVLTASNSKPSEDSYKNISAVGSATRNYGASSSKTLEVNKGKSGVIANPIIKVDSRTSASCSSSSDGSINISISGGVPPYDYNWTGPGGFSSSNEDIANLSPGTYEITVTDSNGDSSSESIEIIFEDNTKPTISAPADKTVNTDNNQCTSSGVSLGTPTTRDNCGVKSVTNDAPATFPFGNTTVTWTVTDDSDNVQTTTQVITVVDSQKPTISAPADKTVNTDNNQCTASRVSLGTPTTRDNCGVKSVTNDAPATFPLGNTTVTWTVTDNSDNVQTATQVITVVDSQKPTISAPADKTVNTDNNQCTASGVSLGTPTTSDNCGVKSVTNDAPAIFPLGNTTVTWTVTDNSDNVKTTTQVITVVDSQKPTISAPADKTVNTDNNQCTASGVSLETPTTSDNCGVKSVTNDAPATFPLGNTTVTWTVTDNSDNVQTTTQVVTVEDNQAPAAPDLPDLTWSCGMQITDYPITTDNCSAEITATTNNDLEFNDFGSYTIEWVFTDPSGNSVTTTQNILIPEPTVQVPSIDGSEFCNEEVIPEIKFAGNELEDKYYEWSYIDVNNNSIDIGIPSSGSGDIPEFTARNNSSEVIEAVFTIIPYGNGCKGEPVNFTITVNPTPTITKPSDISVCAGETVEEIKFPGASVSGTSKSWTNNNTNIGLKANGNGKINSFTATNDTSESIFATVTVTPSANGCEGIAETFTIEVKPKAKVEPLEDFTFCNGVATTAISLTGPVEGTTYDIEGGSSIGLSNKSSVTEISSFTPDNNSTSPATAEISVTPKANGCTGEPEIFSITVNPTPNITISPASQALCSGETTGITFTGAVAGTSYSWTVSEIIPSGSISGGSDGSGDKIEQNLTNTTGSPAKIIYKVTPEANGCPGTPISVTVTVNPLPEFSFKTEQLLCSPADLTSLELTEDSTQGLSFSYFKNGNQVQNPNSVNAGFYTIIGKNSSGCTTEQEVTVNETPKLTVPLDAPETCSNSSFTYELTSSIPDTEFSWQRLANPNISSNTTGGGNGDIGENLTNMSDKPIEVTYVVTLTSPEGCTANQEIKTLVNPIPKLNNPSTDPEQDFVYNYIACGGENFEFSPSSNTPNTTFHWERQQVGENSATNGSGNINEKLINSGSSEITAVYKIFISSNECDNPNPYEIRVLVKPAPVVNASIVSSGAAENPNSEFIEICPGTTSVDLYSNATLENTENLPPEIDSWDFSSSSARNAWSTDPSHESRRWRTGQNGDLAYERDYRCGYRNRYICTEEYEYAFQNINSPFFAVNSYQYEGNYDNVALISPSFSTIGYSSVTLNFDHAYRDAGSIYDIEADIARVQFRINYGNWQNLVSYTSSIGSEEQMVPGRTNNNQEIKLPGNKENVQIRFLYNTHERGYYGIGFWAIGNVNITGEGAEQPNITWTRSDDENWISHDQNLQNIEVNMATTFTATYEYESVDCPGTDSVEVIVRTPPEPTITANYCGSSQFIELVSDNEYSSYRWEANGEVLGTNRTLDVEIAKTYTLIVTDDLGCEGTGYINVSNELITNGDFEDGNTGFYTEYNYKPNPTAYTNNNQGTSALWAEQTYTISNDARQNPYSWHPHFYGQDHTYGNGHGNFMLINGAPASGKVVWRQTIENIQPNTNYYFNAWGMNLNPSSPARLQFKVNGVNTGTIAELSQAATPTSNGQVNRANWVQFYSNPFWNSGNSTTAVLEIVNLNTNTGGNDFGLDDISFGTLETIVFEIDPDNNSILCEGEELELYANIEGGRFPITFKWTGPAGSNFSHTTTVNTLQELNEAVTLKVPDITADMAGTYNLEVTDFYGCASQTATTEVKILKINSGEDQTVCSNAAEVTLAGTIIGSEAGGTWSTSGSGTFSNNTQLDAIYTASEDDIAAGSVSLSLTSNDAKATCTDELTIFFNISPEMTIEVTPANCYQSNDATATVIIAENTGTAPFTYLWSDGQTGQTATRLGKTGEADNLFVTVTDANGCSVSSENIVIEEPAPLEIVATEFDAVTCFGANDGTATIEVTGGFLEGASPEYNFQLLDSEGAMVYTEENVASPTITVPNLTAGNYTFSVSTPANCTSLTSNITITQPEEIIVDAGTDLSLEQCGITQVQLEAVPVDESLGEGEWHVISGQDGYFEDAHLPNTIFYGKANTTYELEWAVIPKTDCPELSDTLTVHFPESCSKLNFDGEDDYVDAGENYAMGGNDFSVEAWVKPNAISGVNTIISKRVEGESNLGYDLILNNGAPSFRVRNRSVTSTKKIATDRWYHIAGVYSDSQMSLYVDGVEIQKNTNNIPGGSGNFEAPFLIGAAHSPASTRGTKEHFNGFIEEVRIWKGAIPTAQIRFFMNQRLWKNGSKVDGEVLEQEMNITNAPTLPNYSNLPGYYQLLAREDLISSGYTENLGSEGSKADGLLKNIQQMQENTAPLPYVLYTSNKEWYNKSTWQLPQKFNGKTISQRDVWDAPNSLGIDNQTKIDWNIVKIGDNVYNPGTPNNKNSITLLGLLSEDGKFDMQGDNNHNGSGLTVTHYLKLNGIIDLNGESQLIQSEGSILDPESSGYIQRDQQGTQNSYNYNYWSSPVSYKDKPINSGYSIAAVLHDGTNPSTPKPISFGNSHTFADGNYSGNLRISAYWLNIFHGTADEYGVWKHIDATTHLEPGTGYTMKGTSGSAKIKDLQNYIFEGKPNNGTIKIKISENENRLVGNPYPSVIDAREFIKDNLKNINGGRNTRNIFNGTIYFWDHFGQEDTHVLAEYIGGYAAFTLAGSVPGVSNDKRIHSNGNSGTKLPGNGIPVAQGFFVNTILDETVAGDITVSGGEVVFKNSQRTYVRENPGNSQFLRPENIQKQQKEMAEDTRPKIRLNFVSPTGYHRQILATADLATTDDFDLGYDAPMMDYNAEDMFWMIKNGEFVIQAVKDFGLKRTLPLGLYISEEKEFEISIDSLENLPENFEVFIRDNETGTHHNLSEGSFTATLAPGYYTTRFDIVFSDVQEEEPGEETEEEGNTGENPDEEENSAESIQITYNHKTRNLRIDNPEVLEISELMVFDIRGRLVEAFEELPSEKQFYLPVKDFSSGIYIVKMIYSKGIKNVKIIMR
ncbi:PKD-like domain-containing protein [Zunongwangia sp. F363]|uniref:PKD-like domain-containing protein n=1 Tax=Autumnicola tepida TaxID=3075595 RepID=A0ABU3C5S0_9FLAO|nr:PKD-like domain-containing protein [Zunongwangia sp. F363]MDT0641670.1 PKD-like domain-containing protein [Zunongwangia sp. F363]